MRYDSGSREALSSCIYCVAWTLLAFVLCYAYFGEVVAAIVVIVGVIIFLRNLSDYISSRKAEKPWRDMEKETHEANRKARAEFELKNSGRIEAKYGVELYKVKNITEAKILACKIEEKLQDEIDSLKCALEREKNKNLELVCRLAELSNQQ